MLDQTHIFRSETVSPFQHIQRDEEGFLLDASEWQEDYIEPIAAEMDIVLSEEHMEIIRYIRSYYEQNRAVPEARTLLKYLKEQWGEARATRRYLYRLFPYGYGQQACKIAGMTKPRKLMLDV
jgi:TusE/DsrC/DsvC family sulfur relay protein